MQVRHVAFERRVSSMDASHIVWMNTGKYFLVVETKPQHRKGIE